MLNIRSKPGHSKDSERRRREWQWEMVEPFKKEHCRFEGTAGQDEGQKERVQGIVYLQLWDRFLV